MFDFLSSIFSPRSYLGVDIGTTSIKIVEIEKGRGKPELKNYGILESHGHLERVNDAIYTSSLKMADKETAELLKIILSSSKFKTKNAVASIPSFSSFITFMEIPQMPAADTAKALQFQIRQYIPLPSSDVAIDWLKIGEKEDQRGFIRQQIILIAVPNEQLFKYREIFKLAGLRLMALEVESLSLVRSLVAGDQTLTLLVDIGGRSTSIMIVDKGTLRHGSHTDFAGASLTQAIANGLQINVRRAEDLKRRKGLVAKGGEYELSTLTSFYLDAIINEVKRAKEIAENNQEIKLERIILAGGGANLPGIGQYFESQIGLPTVIGNSFLTLKYPDQIEPIAKELGSTLGVAIGLGIREFV